MRLQLALKGLTAVNARVVKRRFYLLNYRNQRGKAQNPIYIRLSDSHRISLNIIIKATGVPEDIMVKLTAPADIQSRQLPSDKPSHLPDRNFKECGGIERSRQSRCPRTRGPWDSFARGERPPGVKDPLRLLEAISIQRPLSKTSDG